jgi:hypothetical protein
MFCNIYFLTCIKINKMDFKILSIVLFIVILLTGCSKDDDDVTCDTSDITYTNSVAAVLNNSCAVSGCHINGNEANTWFSLEGYANSKAAADFGRIEGAISHKADFSPMPKGSDKLDQCEIDKIIAWIEAGAPE